MSNVTLLQPVVNMSLSRCYSTAEAVGLRAFPLIFRQSCAVTVSSALCVRGYCSASSSTAAPCFNSNYRKLKMYIAEERGSPYAPDYRVYFKDAGGPISPLHDIPLWADRSSGLLNMVVEVPRWTNAKCEISLSEPLNPIKQDVKKGALRFVANVFPHKGYIWNYGALPQTWENPRHVDPRTRARGDNDPIDVIEIGSRVAARGDVLQVKVLGVLALVDEGETDWKLLAVDSRDPLAPALADVGDVERLRPGLLQATVEWFRLYKVPDGKPVNEFAFGGEAKDKDFAYKVIDEVHEHWRALVSGEVPDANDINTMNVSVAGSAGHVERPAAAAELARAPPPGAPAPIPSAVDKWHHLASL